MEITNDVKYLGVDDFQTDLFEGQYAVPNGIAYNSYAILDQKTAVMDTVDTHFSGEWLEHIRAALDDRDPDYLIVQHMEQDHSANIGIFMEQYPNAVIVSSAPAFAMMKQFFGTDYPDRRRMVKDGDTLSLGSHCLTFIGAPMVHWPEVLMTYDSLDRILFSADAFGKFGALSVNDPWEEEARRYAIGIVGKYGPQVIKVLNRVSSLDLQIICPLHGPVLKENLDHYLNLYRLWFSYQPESEGVVIAYASAYGNTREAAELLAFELLSRGCPAVAMHDLARNDLSRAIADAFRYPKLVLASITYNAGISPFMAEYISRLNERCFQNRTVALIENGSWAPTAAKTMKGMLESCKNIIWADTMVQIRSALNENSRTQVLSLAEELWPAAD